MIFLKSSALNDDVFGKSQNPIKKFLMDSEAVEKRSHDILEKIFTMYTDDKFAAKFSSFAEYGDFADVGENGTYPESEAEVGYSKTIDYFEWKSKFSVSKTMLEDATMFDIKARAANFAAKYYRIRSKYGASILNNGASTSMTFGAKSYDISCNDTLALFSTAHTSKTGNTSTQSNYFNAGFSYENLCKVEELGHKLKNDSGEEEDIQYDTIIIPDAARIKRIVADALWTKGDERPGTSDHSNNYQAGRWNIITWGKLTNPSGITTGNDVWYVMDSKRAKLDGLMWGDRIPLQVKSWIDDETDANLWGGRARFGAAPVNFRCIARCAAGLGSSIADS